MQVYWLRHELGSGKLDNTQGLECLVKAPREQRGFKTFKANAKGGQEAAAHTAAAGLLAKDHQQKLSEHNKARDDYASAEKDDDFKTNKER
eukprot:scaffold114208_cov18-Tisochrysis_lutea.AAC.1